MFIRHHTTNFGDTAARIKKHVAKLDKDWFLRKKREFVKLCADGEDSYEVGDEHNAQIVDFDIYCFSSNYSKGITGSSITDKIIETTNAIILDAGDDKDFLAFQYWIENVKGWIKEEIDEKATYYNIEEYTHVMYGVVRKIQWEIDYYFNDKLNALQLKYLRNLSATKSDTDNSSPTKIAAHSFADGYDTGSLKEVFLPHAIPPFIEIEERLLADGILNNVPRFINKKGNKQKLIALIYHLIDCKYFRPKFPGKSINNNFSIYRRYFERRYGTKLDQSVRKFEPTEHKDLFDYLALFTPALDV